MTTTIIEPAQAISWKYSDEIAANPQWLGMARQASGWAAERFGQFTAGKTWEWSISPVNDDIVFDLLLTYGNSTVADRFTRFEIANEDLFKRRLGRLWDKLTDSELKSAYDRMQKNLREWRDELAAEEEAISA